MEKTSSQNQALTDREKAMLRELQKRQDAVDEIERRNNVRLVHSMSDDFINTLNLPSSVFSEDFETLSLQLNSIHNYKFAVVNKAHRGLNPWCDRPAFRILGLFRTEGEFVNWMEEMKELRCIYFDEVDEKMKCKLGDLHKLPLLQYTLIAKTATRERDESYTKQKISNMKNIHLEHMKMARQEFEEHREKRVQGHMGLSLEKKRQNANKKYKSSGRAKALKTCDKTKKREALKTMQEVSRVPRSMELSKQNQAIIIVLNDVTENTLAGKDDPEPAILILDSFESCEEAEKYIEKLKNYVFCLNIDVVDMYVWHFPEEVDFDQVKEKYRNPEQDKIMNEKKVRKLEVEKVEAESRMMNKPLPLQEVTEHSKAPENFNPLEQQPKFTYSESSEPVNRKALFTEENEQKNIVEEENLEDKSKISFY